MTAGAAGDSGYTSAGSAVDPGTARLTPMLAMYFTRALPMDLGIPGANKGPSRGPWVFHWQIALFPVGRTLVVRVDFAIPGFVGHQRPGILVESGRLFE